MTVFRVRTNLSTISLDCRCRGAMKWDRSPMVFNHYCTSSPSILSGRQKCHCLCLATSTRVVSAWLHFVSFQIGHTHIWYRMRLNSIGWRDRRQWWPFPIKTRESSRTKNWTLCETILRDQLGPPNWNRVDELVRLRRLMLGIPGQKICLGYLLRVHRTNIE